MVITWILIGALFALIALVLLLPRVPAVRRAAGVDPGGEILQTPPFLYIPSAFVNEDEQKGTQVPERILTRNYRGWQIASVARTADQMSSLSPRLSSVTVMPEAGEDFVKTVKRVHHPGLSIHFYSPAPEPPKLQEASEPEELTQPEPPAVEKAAATAFRVPVAPALRQDILAYALASGNRVLATSYALEERVTVPSED
jgi:hypothetical protein